MNAVINNYIQSFLHPFDQHEKLHGIREGLSKRKKEALTVVSEDSLNEEIPVKLSFVEAMSVSWLLKMVYSFYSIVSIHLGLISYKLMSEDSSFADLLFNDFPMKAQKALLFTTLLSAIFYPLVLWIYTKFWSVIIKFFSMLFDIKGDVESMTDEVVNHSLVSNMFLLIPVFGEAAKNFCSFIYIFAGLKKNFGMNSLQSIVVLSAPLFLFIVMLLCFSLIFMLFVNIL